MAADLDALPGTLAPVLAGARDPDTVLIPWQGWSLSSADFVLTRTMEVLVHSDDLAASIGVETPVFPTRPRMPCSPSSRRSPPSGTARPRCCAR